MKEPVRKTQHPLVVGACVVAIAGLYFVLLAKNRYPEPGPNLLYDIDQYREVDNIETRYEEVASFETGLENPRALAVDDEDRIYVAGNDAVRLFSPSGEVIDTYKVNGTPSSMAIAADGTLYLGIRNRVEAFDSTGVEQARWPDLGPKGMITSIAVDEEFVFVADAGNRVVHRFNREGVLEGRLGEADEDRDIPGIVVPSPYFDVAFDDEGSLWVVNPGRMGLENYRSNGDIITSWYNPSLKLEGFSGCCNPAHIAFDGAGRLIAVDKGLVRIKVYEVTSGEFKELVAGSKMFPKTASLRDLAVDSNNRILVLDPTQNAVRIFGLKEGGYEQTDQSS